MNDDELRARLAASVPPSDPVDPIDSDRARALMEEIMSTVAEPRAPMSRRMTGVAAALALVIGAGAVAASLMGRPEPLVLTGPAGDATASCLPFDGETLSGMSPAFGGTVVELTDSVATIEVDRWFAGGDAEIVEIEYTPGFEALIGTPDLEVGERYLITASDGVVNGCGYSGLATADYEASFENAFGA